MIKLDHLRIPVTDLARSRGWYVRALGLEVEFEVPDRQSVSIEFAHAPQKTYWGYGAELGDPEGYLIRLWDERSMREK